MALWLDRGFKENLREKDPCLENFGTRKPPIWAAHTRTINMLYPPGKDMLYKCGGGISRE